jgi:hypothetical protein
MPDLAGTADVVVDGGSAGAGFVRAAPRLAAVAAAPGLAAFPYRDGGDAQADGRVEPPGGGLGGDVGGQQPEGDRSGTC